MVDDPAVTLCAPYALVAFQRVSSLGGRRYAAYARIAEQPGACTCACTSLIA